MVIQTNGGMYQEQRPYLWARDMPVVLAQKLVDRYADDYHIWAQIGTEYGDSYYPCFVTHYSPKQSS